MSAFVKDHKRLTATIGFLALLVALIEAWSVAAPVRGRMAARTDLRRGRYKLLTYGLPPSWLPEYGRILKERYGVELQPVAGCVVSTDLVSYVDNYDDVSIAGANHKFGRDVFKESEVEASKTRITPDDVSQSREYFLDGDFTIITTVDALPRPVLQALTEDGIVRLLMANPGEKFDATDVISDSSAPRMRLIFGGAGNGKFLIHYEQGGRSHMFVLALFNLVSPNNAKLMWRAYCNNGASTLAQLRSRVLTGECR